MDLSYKIETTEREKIRLDSLIGGKTKVIVFVRHLG